MRVPNIKRNVFNLSHEKKLSCDMGKLIPIMLQEVVPGDYIKNVSTILVRLSPLVAPIMHQVDVFTHFWFVPNRLLWSDWEKFITGGEDGKDATTWPYKTLSSVAAGDLADYFGIPVFSGFSMNVSALPFRAYTLCWNEWYRNLNIQNAQPMSKGNGADSTTPVSLLSRNWAKDYFTSALPWAQRGDPVTLPLGNDAPITGIGKNSQTFVGTNGAVYETDGSGTKTYAKYGVFDGTTNNIMVVEEDPNNAGYPNIRVDLSEASAATVNDLRYAFQVQKWFERNARGGARYIEVILNQFGVRSSDARLQRPEFLGGGRSPIVISETLQTSESSVDSPQGNMAGHAFSVQTVHAFKQSFEEHGLILGLLSVMPKAAYQQGLNRLWSRDSRYKYYWPLFANIGEQEILNKELFVANDGDNDEVFGFQGRYDEYRRQESTVHGQFKTSLNFWHMGRIFGAGTGEEPITPGTRPTLSDAFVTCSPTKRISAVTDEHNCLVQVKNHVVAVRPIPLVSEPGLIDH